MKPLEKKVLLLLAMAQLILTLDSTVMNVSISTLVKDLNTTVGAVQSAIAFYTLVMAAFMIAGAKIGDIIGRKKAFIIGLCIYGTGSLITSLAPNIQVLTFGWSFLEGLGAALVVPAMISLISANFEKGPKRVKAYGNLAAMAAIGAAIGPIIGGLLTTYASWRYVFAGEVLIVLFILINNKTIQDAHLVGKKPKLDWLGAGLTAAGMFVIVQGILLANTYGFFRARVPFSIGNDVVLQAGQVSPSILFVLGGLVILGIFVLWEIHRQKAKKDVLVHLRLFGNQIVQSGLGSILTLYLIMGGTMYAMALYTQVNLGYSAILSGLTLLPMSIMIMILASRGAIMAAKFAPRYIVRGGFILVFIGAVLLGLFGKNATSGWALVPGIAVAGAGIGIIMSQLQNLVQSSVELKDASETSGLMATFQNLGMSLGTALSGVLLIISLLGVSTQLINQNTQLNDTQKAQLTAAYQQNAQIASNAQVEAATASLPPDLSNEVVEINAQARQTALSRVFLLFGVLSLLGLVATVKLPKVKPGPNALEPNL
ncbi:MAG: MFS transporter [Candidatus Saccharibacteria bacterium]